jgi:16S rRNA (guanine527-N7)-methyltransferase
MSSTPDDDAARVVAALADLSPRLSLDSLTIYIQELLAWNQQIGLVSKQNTPSVIEHLVRQSLALWDFVSTVARPERVADVGAGGGFPGLIWGLLDRNVRLCLIERKTRRAFFLERAAWRLRLPNAEVLGEDVREVARRPGFAGAFDAVAMVAVAAPGDLAPPVARLLRGGGYFCCLRPSREEKIPQTLDDTLTLTARQDVGDAIYLLYRKDC